MRIFIEPVKDCGLHPTIIPDVTGFHIKKEKLIIDTYSGPTITYKLNLIEYAETDRISSPIRLKHRLF